MSRSSNSEAELVLVPSGWVVEFGKIYNPSTTWERLAALRQAELALIGFSIQQARARASLGIEGDDLHKAYIAYLAAKKSVRKSPTSPHL